LDTVFLENKTQLIFELHHSDLDSYVMKFNGRIMDEAAFLERKKIFYQIVQAIAYLHSKNILHRDLKPKNILMTEDGVPRIADFGWARKMDLLNCKYTQGVVTLYYRAPEILLGAVEYSREIDIWALGCIFAEIFLGRTLFKGDSEIDQIFKIFQILGTPSEEHFPCVLQYKNFKTCFPTWHKVPLRTVCSDLNEDGIDLLEKMLCYDPLERISAASILSHKFFCDIFPIK